MRTDTQRLDWILAALDSGNNEPIERLQAAYTLELRGRAAMDAAMGAKAVEPGEPMPALTAIDMATAELGRIRNVKGFSEERDDGYLDAELLDAAICYLFGAEGNPHNQESLSLPPWPTGWDAYPFKPSPDDRKKELTKGIALALCELDRLIRAERREVIDAGHDCEAQVCAEMNAAACEPEDADRGFNVGEDVTYPNYDTGLPERGEYRGHAFGGWAKVAVAGGVILLFPYAELEHADD